MEAPPRVRDVDVLRRRVGEPDRDDRPRVLAPGDPHEQRQQDQVRGVAVDRVPKRRARVEAREERPQQRALHAGSRQAQGVGHEHPSEEEGVLGVELAATEHRLDRGACQHRRHDGERERDREHDPHACPGEARYVAIVSRRRRLRHTWDQRHHHGPEEHGPADGGDDPVRVLRDRDRTRWEERHDLLLDEPRERVHGRAGEGPHAQDARLAHRWIPQGEGRRVPPPLDRRPRHLDEHEQRHAGQVPPRDRAGIGARRAHPDDDADRRHVAEDLGARGEHEGVARVEERLEHVAEGLEGDDEEHDPGDRRRRRDPLRTEAGRGHRHQGPRRGGAGDCDHEPGEQRRRRHQCHAPVRGLGAVTCVPVGHEGHERLVRSDRQRGLQAQRDARRHEERVARGPGAVGERDDRIEGHAAEDREHRRDTGAAGLAHERTPAVEPGTILGFRCVVAFGHGAEWYGPARAARPRPPRRSTDPRGAAILG